MRLLRSSRRTGEAAALQRAGSELTQIGPDMLAILMAGQLRHTKTIDVSEDT